MPLLHPACIPCVWHPSLRQIIFEVESIFEEIYILLIMLVTQVSEKLSRLWEP